MNPTMFAHSADQFAHACRTVELPPDLAECAELEAAMVDVIDAIAGLCAGAPDRLGICCDCGKLTARGDRNGGGHDPGGCLFAIPAAVAWHARRLPRRITRRAAFHLGGR